MADFIKFVGGDTWYDMLGDQIQHFGGHPPGNAHFLDIFGAFKLDGHKTRKNTQVEIVLVYRAGPVCVIKSG